MEEETCFLQVAHNLVTFVGYWLSEGKQCSTNYKNIAKTWPKCVTVIYSYFNYMLISLFAYSVTKICDVFSSGHFDIFFYFKTKTNKTVADFVFSFKIQYFFSGCHGKSRKRTFARIFRCPALVFIPRVCTSANVCALHLYNRGIRFNPK